MKKTMIFAGLLASSITIRSQALWNGIGYTGNAYRTGRIGINTTTPQAELDLYTSDPSSATGGMSITQLATTGSAALHLFSNNASGNLWAIYSLGNSNHIGGSSNIGDFALYNGTSGTTPLLVNKTTGNVGIGTISPTGGKLHVVQSVAPTAGYFSAAGNYGGAVTTIALTGHADLWNLSTSTSNIGVDGEANAGNPNYGTVIGVHGAGGAGQWCYGGRFEANGTSNCSGENYGIFATASGCGTNWAAYLSGNVIATAYQVFSDQRLKKDINPMSGALDKIKLLKPSTYTYKTDEFKEMNLPEGKQSGLIAQDLEKVFPELIKEVKGHPDGSMEDIKKGAATAFKSVNYISLIPVLISAMQEQQQQIDVHAKTNADQQTQIENQQKQIDELKVLVNSLAGNPTLNADKSGLTSSTPVQLSDKNTIVLNQNVPNPFAESTVISYNIPTDFAKAQILFSTNDGKIIRTIDITQKGAGSLNVFANDLSNGLYSYSLVVDGKTIDTKKMVKE